jgi:hypothetical protein
MRSPSLITAIVLSVTTTVLADQPQVDNNAVRWTLQAGVVHQSSASLDEGGDMSAGRYFVSGGLGKVFGGRWRLGVSLNYGEDRYNFSGSNGFGALDPWDRTRELQFSMPLQYFTNQGWTVYAIPSVRFNAQSGASLNDGKIGGLIAGASYRVNDTLTIGPGVGVFSEIEDSTNFFPILIIDWKITDTLSLETGSGSAASRGPGLQLRWQTASNWEFAFGGRYEKTRFRLDDKGPAPDGVGQDKAFPLFALAEYALGKDTKVSLIGGAEVSASMRLEDSKGNLITDSNLSTAPFFGATFQTRFQ